MGWISVVFVRKVIAHTEGADTALYRSVGVEPGALDDPRQMVRDVAFFGLLERIADRPGGRTVPLRVGASMRCDDYGAFGLAFKSAIDLRRSYQRVERYGKVVTSIANFEVVAREGTTLMQVIPGLVDRPGLRLTNELALAAAMALSREVCSRAFVLDTVALTHDAPDDVSAFEEHFGCPVHFGADRDALEVRDSLLDSPNRLGDVGISRFFDRHLDGALADLPDDGGLERRVRAAITRSLSEGVPKLPRLASRLGMSGRTLQRRLADAGLAYQRLVDRARQDLAERLLRTSDYELAEVAFLTGFSDQSTFNRAFKRWRGETPGAYRQARP